MAAHDAEYRSTDASSADGACSLAGVELQAEVMRLYYLEKLSIRAI